MTQSHTHQKRILGWRPGTLAGHGGRLLGWMLLRAAAQAVTVVVLARALAAHTYGEFVTVLAVATFATPLVGLGLANMVLRNAARDPQAAPWYLKRSFTTLAWTLLPVAGIAISAALLLIPKGLSIVAMGAAIMGELAATPLAELAGRYRQAQHRYHAYGAINAVLPLARLLILGLLVLLTDGVEITALLWAHAAASFACVCVLWPVVRPATPIGAGLPKEAMPVTSGVPFSASALAMRLQTEFNKPMLAHAGFDLPGTYNIAQRVVDMASLPLMAMQEALWPRLYAQANPLSQLRRTGAALLSLAITVGALVWFAAPLLPAVVGEAHPGSIQVLRMLAWLPVLHVSRSLLNFHAIHHGNMHHISRACIVGAGTSIIAVVVMVPALGMVGAAIASYIAEITMCLVLMGASMRTPR
jgi:O-antigen/teichoic acid export membrane protein